MALARTHAIALAGERHAVAILAETHYVLALHLRRRGVLERRRNVLLRGEPLHERIDLIEPELIPRIRISGQCSDSQSDHTNPPWLTWRRLREQPPNARFMPEIGRRHGL